MDYLGTKSTVAKPLVYRAPGGALVTFVRGWIALVAVMALGNSVQCFVSPDFVWTKLYNAPTAGGSDLTARTYGMWTLLASIIRFLCAYNLYNWELYLATMLTFLVALAHFVSEMLYFRTGLVEIGMITPIIISGASFFLMIFATSYIWPSYSEEEEFVDIRHLAKGRKPEKRKN